MKDANANHRSRNLPSTNRIITQEQYRQIFEAIEARKYSWACLLILRFAGDNPRLYIPYRTVNRLIKENQSVPADDGKLQ